MTRDIAFACVEFAAIAAIAVFGFWVSPLIGLLVLASVSLMLRSKGWSHAGFHCGDRTVLVLTTGAVLGTAALLGIAWLWAPALEDLSGRAVELNVLPPLRGHSGLLVTALLLAFASAFAIEMVFRGYLFERIRELINNDALAIVASAAAYAAVVAEQGLASVVGALVMGVGYGLMYLAGNRTLVFPIAFHCAFDSTNLVLIYLKVVG